MTLFIHLSKQSGLSRYRQIERQIRAAVAAGTLATGDRLPTVRELAEKLAVNPATVVAAYDLLEADGIIERRHGSGTYISADTTTMNNKDRKSKAAAAMDFAVNEAGQLGFDAQETRTIFEKSLARKESKR